MRIAVPLEIIHRRTQANHSAMRWRYNSARRTYPEQPWERRPLPPRREMRDHEGY
jgi:hypothetical protein